VLQCVAVCCSVLQCDDDGEDVEWRQLCCSALQCVTLCCSVLQCVAVCCSVLQCVAVCCSVLQCNDDDEDVEWRLSYGVATISRLFEIIGLFCK